MLWLVKNRHLISVCRHPDNTCWLSYCSSRSFPPHDRGFYETEMNRPIRHSLSAILKWYGNDRSWDHLPLKLHFLLNSFFSLSPPSLLMLGLYCAFALTSPARAFLYRPFKLICHHLICHQLHKINDGSAERGNLKTGVRYSVFVPVISHHGKRQLPMTSGIELCFVGDRVGGGWVGGE